MSGRYDEFWSNVPAKADHPVRVPMLEAMRWIVEPLSALDLVDVLDGDLSMWESAHHLIALEALGVVESTQAPGGRPSRGDEFDRPYRLIGHDDV